MLEIACFACDLKNDSSLIKKYIEYHQNVWPEILEDIRAQGIKNMEILHVGDRLFMIVTPTEEFFSKCGEFSWTKSEKFANRSEKTIKKLNEWEDLMDTYQKRLPDDISKGVKWVKMEKIFNLM